ncbi:SIR2 family protein [Ruegeria sp.]|uniref:SIR2 family protein n=1 Tax=Ruegeria sp. TaxID=1879320 RepID=UPI00231A2A89|nr:SIR2 family protein [Ruegeria sp.]MDA7965471.1 SIR2 family protein [Ruegeria sp.]
MIDWPDELVTDLARRKAIILLGSGVSKHAEGRHGIRPQDWKGFLKQALNDCPADDVQHIEKAIKEGDFLHACEWLKSRYDESWPAYLRKHFLEQGYQPGEIHRLLVALDSRIVFSLNFDDIYERCANHQHAGALIVKSYFDDDIGEILRGTGRYLVKVHGALNTPQSLIFTQKDYAHARIKHAQFYQAFDACLLTHSFLFVGAGYSDPDINLVLENQNFGFPHSRPHYFLTSSDLPDDRISSLRANRNLKTIKYDKIDDNHSGLVNEIKNLVSLVDEERQIVRDETNW